MYLALTGRQQELALAELEALFGVETLVRLNNESVFIENESAKNYFPRLGSTVALARVIGRFDGSFEEIADAVDIASLLDRHSRRKISLGLSVYGRKVSLKSHQSLLFSLSKRLQQNDKSVREIRSKTQTLSSAQVFHNRLDDITKNCELVCSFDHKSKQWIIGQTVAVQNITAYRVRDRERPKRDTFVGMLPPKLAQTLINLTEITDPNGKTLLDPFCGTGVVLQEAALMGFDVYGTDVSSRMIDYTVANLQWLKTPKLFHPKLEVGDAEKHTWGKPVDAITSEVFLGKPLKTTPSSGELKNLKSENRNLIEAFVKNLHSQIEPGTPVVLALPAWRTPRGFEPAITFDDLKKFGYNPVEFQHVESDKLIYARDDQIVGRKIFVLRKV